MEVYFKAVFSNVETQSDYVFSSLFGIFLLFLALDNAVSYILLLGRNELR